MIMFIFGDIGIGAVERAVYMKPRGKEAIDDSLKFWHASIMDV